MENRSPGAFVLPFDQTGGYALRVAVSNPAASAANVAAAVYDDTGAMISGTTVALAAMGHTGFMLADEFPASAGRRGTLVFTVPQGGQLATLALRANASGSLASVLPLTKQRMSLQLAPR